MKQAYEQWNENHAHLYIKSWLYSQVEIPIETCPEAVVKVFFTEKLNMHSHTLVSIQAWQN